LKTGKKRLEYFIEVHNILRFKETLTVLEELHLKTITLLEPEGLGGEEKQESLFWESVKAVNTDGGRRMKKDLLNLDELDIDEMDLDEKYLGQRFPCTPEERVYLLKLLKRMLQRMRPEEVRDYRELILDEAKSIAKNLKCGRLDENHGHTKPEDRES